MAEDKTRVDFNAPTSLVERADRVADVLGTSRTRLLIDALQDELDEIVGDETFQRRLREAFYTGRIDGKTVETVLGRDEATRLKLLRASLDRELPDPQVEGGLPDADDFYTGSMPEWTPEGEPVANSDHTSGDG